MDAYISLCGKRLAMVESVRLRTERGAEAACAYGDESGFAVAVWPMKHHLELTSVMPLPGFLNDFYELKNFDVEIGQNGRVTVFRQCEWTALESDLHARDGKIEKISLVSPIKITDKTEAENCE